MRDPNEMNMNKRIIQIANQNRMNAWLDVQKMKGYNTKRSDENTALALAIITNLQLTHCCSHIIVTVKTQKKKERKKPP